MTAYADGSGAWPSHRREVRRWATDPDVRDTHGRSPPREDRLLAEIEVSIPPAIAELLPLLSRETMVAVEAATAAVAGFDRGSGTHVAPLSGFLLRSESIATSKIERITANANDLARALAGQEAGRAAEQTAAALGAINEMVERAGSGAITLDAITDAHRVLMAGDRFEGHEAGRTRRVQNWIGGSDFSPRGAVHVPPPHDLVDPLLADLVTFANRDDVPAVAQAAIAHAQFESIHPFTDGNGRIGRALINAVLRRRDLTTRVVVPIASVLLADVDSYFAQLDAYRAGDADAFVRTLADASVIASEEAVASGESLAALPSAWRDRVTARKGSATDRLLERLLEAPVLTDRTAAELAGSSVRRIYDALDRLTAAGVLDEITGKRRDRIWIVADVLDELDRLEERIGRRRRPSR